MSENLTACDLWTDGACSGNPGPGGWAAILVVGQHRKELSGGEAHTTNNRMEILGILKGLEVLTRRCHVRIHTDSAYVMDAITKWLPGWRRRDWKTRDGKPVKNRELFEALDAQLKRHTTEWIKIKGHANVPLNERCDELAVAACKTFGGSGNRRRG